MRYPAIVKERPAETGGVALAAATVIAAVLGVNDPEVVVALAVVIGAAPAVITGWRVRRRPR